MDWNYCMKKLYMVAMALLIVGGLNWLLVGTVRKDIVALVLGKGWIARSVYIVIGLCALAIMFNRDTYLPFLGESLVPCAAIQEKTPPGATVQMQVDVPPGAKVLYWAAEPATEKLHEVQNWKQAYLDVENAGVTVADSNGIATLRVRRPQPYLVPWKGKLEPHIHFRICGEGGFLGRTKTVFLEDGHVEGFQGV
jgi:uncharacterized membrane protein YuzA (DUF378 family)